MAQKQQILLECTNCQTVSDFKGFSGVCPNCGDNILESRYELDKLNVEEWLTELKKRPATLWRYHEVLPIYDTDHIVSMGEGGTPLVKSENLAASLGLKHLYIKDERQGTNR